MVNINQAPRDENGLKHGEWIVYHYNGQLDYRWNYVHGISHGLCERYNIDGTLWYRGCHNMGNLIGYWYAHKKKYYYLWLI